MTALAFAAAIWACAAPAGAAVSSAVWTIDGLADPESAYYDAGSRSLFISNVNGDPAAKDGNGFITKADLNGKVSKLKWVTGLNGPKGLKACGGRLYVADIDQIVVIKIASGTIERRIGLPGAKFLHDVTSDKKCQLYVSDLFGSAIYKVAAGEARLWMDGPDLQSPNGLYWLEDKLVIAAWGLTADGSTQTPGRLLAVDLVRQGVSPLLGPLGHLDGLQRYKDGWLVTDFVNGTLLQVAANGKSDVLLHGLEGPADISVVASQGLLLLPELKRGRVSAYKLSTLAR